MSHFDPNQEYLGATWNLEVRRARKAIRRAAQVYMAVVLCVDDDAVYVRVSKAVALRVLDGMPDGTTTTAMVRGNDGWVFFN